MTFQAGKLTSFAVQDAGGVSRDLSIYMDKADLDRNVDMLETSCFGTNSKTYVSGLFDGTIPIEGYYDPTATTGVDVVLAGILGGAPRNFIFGPYGTTTTNVKYTGAVILKSYKISSAVAEIVAVSAEFQITGDVTKGVY